MPRKNSRGFHVLVAVASIPLSPSGVLAQGKTSLKDFYDKTTFGAVGFSLTHMSGTRIKSSRSPEDLVQTLEPGKINILPTQEKYCFIINHRIDESEAMNAAPSFIGIKLVVNDTLDVPPVYLFRNSGWILRKSAYPSYTDKPRRSRAGLVEFNNLHSPRTGYTPSIGSMDARLGLQWHGQPVGSTSRSLDSFSFFKSESRFESPQPGKGYSRPYFSEDFLRTTSIKLNPLWSLVQGNRPDFAQTLTGFLLSYTPAPENLSSSSLASSSQKAVFCFDRHRAISAYMKIFIPLKDRDVTSWFSLVLDRNSRLVSK